MVDIWLDTRMMPEEVHQMVNHPDISTLFTADLRPSLDMIRYAMSSPDTGIFMVRVKPGIPIGVVAVRWFSPVCCKVSGGFIKSARGRMCKEAMTLIFQFLYEKVGVLKITGEVAATNRASLRMCAFMGFRREGLNRASGINAEGKVVDTVYWGQTIGEFHGWLVRQRTKRSSIASAS